MNEQQPTPAEESTAPTVTLDRERANHEHETNTFWTRLDQIRGASEGASIEEVGRAGEIDTLEDGRSEG